MPTNGCSLKDDLVGCQVLDEVELGDDEVKVQHKCGSCPGGRSCQKCLAGRYPFDSRYDCGSAPVVPLNTSLDKYVSSSEFERRSVREGGPLKWSRKQKRGYNRVLSCLQYWQSRGYQMLWVMLSSSPESESGKLAENHYRLRQMVESQGFPGIQHFQVRTSEGNGVLHVIWAWKAEDGFREKLFFVRQSWLSKAWDKLHCARVVWISKIGKSRRDSMQVARYCIAQYLGEQSGYEYMSYSWKRAFGFPLVSCWRKFKELARSYGELVRNWSKFLSGEVVWCDYGGFNLGSIRLGYQSYGREFWSMLHWV